MAYAVTSIVVRQMPSAVLTTPGRPPVVAFRLRSDQLDACLLASDAIRDGPAAAGQHGPCGAIGERGRGRVHCLTSSILRGDDRRRQCLACLPTVLAVLLALRPHRRRTRDTRRTPPW